MVEINCHHHQPKCFYVSSALISSALQMVMIVVLLRIRHCMCSLRCTGLHFGWSISTRRHQRGHPYGAGLGACLCLTWGSLKKIKWRVSSKPRWLIGIRRGVVDGRAQKLWKRHRSSLALRIENQVASMTIPALIDLPWPYLPSNRPWAWPRTYTPSFAAAVLQARRTLRKTRGPLPEALVVSQSVGCWVW